MNHMLWNTVLECSRKKDHSESWIRRVLSWARKDRNKNIWGCWALVYTSNQYPCLKWIRCFLSILSYKLLLNFDFFPFISRNPHFNYFFPSSGKPWENNTRCKYSVAPRYFIRIYSYTCALIQRYYLTSQILFSISRFRFM